MFKKLLVLLLVIAPVSLLAQDRIAYINTEEVFQKMPEFKQIEVKIQEKYKTIEKESAAMEGEFNELVQKYSKSDETVTEEVQAKRQQTLLDLQERYQKYMQDSEAGLQEEQQKLLMPLREKMQKAIHEVGSENKYTYIMDIAIFVYTSPTAIDATKHVKAKLGILN